MRPEHFQADASKLTPALGKRLYQMCSPCSKCCCVPPGDNFDGPPRKKPRLDAAKRGDASQFLEPDLASPRAARQVTETPETAAASISKGIVGAIAGALTLGRGTCAPRRKRSTDEQVSYAAANYIAGAKACARGGVSPPHLRAVRGERPDLRVSCRLGRAGSANLCHQGKDLFSRQCSLCP